MSEFCNMIQFDLFDDDAFESDGVKVITNLIESGRTGRFLHFMENGMKQWEIVVAMEDALIDHPKIHNTEWEFVVGRLVDDMETEGWLEHDGFVFVPYGPTRGSRGSQIGVWAAEEFYCNDELVLEVWASTPCAPESGMILNKYLKEKHYIKESLGS